MGRGRSVNGERATTVVHTAKGRVGRGGSIGPRPKSRRSVALSCAHMDAQNKFGKDLTGLLCALAATALHIASYSNWHCLFLFPLSF